VLTVFEREWMEAEDVMQLRQFLLPGRFEVKPKELVLLQLVTDPRLVDAGEERYLAAELVVAVFWLDCFRLPDSHGRLLG
jgi:hypothetical protein